MSYVLLGLWLAGIVFGAVLLSDEGPFRRVRLVVVLGLWPLVAVALLLLYLLSLRAAPGGPHDG